MLNLLFLYMYIHVGKGKLDIHFYRSHFSFYKYFNTIWLVVGFYSSSNLPRHSLKQIIGFVKVL